MDLLNVDIPQEFLDSQPDEFRTPALKRIVESLRCPVCHDIMEAPRMLARCHHLGCSRCIAIAIESTRSCPVCREHVVTKDILDPPQAIQMACAALVQALPTLKQLEKHALEKQTKHTVSSDQLEIPSDMKDEESDALIDCPICGEFFTAQQLAEHAPVCASKRFDGPSGSRRPFSFLKSPPPSKLEIPTTRLTLVDLRNKLSKHGIEFTKSESRFVLERRYRKFVVEYNSFVDHKKRKPTHTEIQRLVMATGEALHSPPSGDRSPRKLARTDTPLFSESSSKKEQVILPKGWTAMRLPENPHIFYVNEALQRVQLHPPG